mmetsp:Transcript_110489/g.236104  ORF Transcript_110489/g.236104 Transcript_110489/m.236104 type:complete len:169 (-) Transcript_110489:92-598(-)
MAAATSALGCSLPSTRDILCFAGGASAALLAVSVAQQLRERSLRAARGPPRVLPPPPRVVEVDSGAFTIDEHCGNASNGDARMSLAQVTVGKTMTEPPQTPQFDEYILVIEGEVRVSVDDEAEPSLAAKAGRAIWLPKGRRYFYIFPGPCRYVPICLPAFHPSLSDRK